MKFIVIDHRAAATIVSDRFLQSAQFSQGRELAGVLQGSESEKLAVQGARLVREADGIYILGESNEREHYLVFDLEQANPFDDRTAADVVLIFQRVLRFAVRIWENLKLSPHERLISGTTKAAVFPFPLSLFRLSIERQPDVKRIRQNGAASGNHLLVYRYGMDEGAGPDERPNVHNFSVALRSVEAARKKIEEIRLAEGNGQLKALGVSVLRTPGDALLSPHLGFAHWLHQLTKVQSDFVLRPVSGPERIEGPAGTGKTVSLVLKCINNLRMARQQGQEHHAIFIAYGEATRMSIRQVFESNDEDGFYLKGRHDSPQTVLITTLQSWCGSHLNTGISEAEFLDRDAMEARELRLLYIEECVSEALQEDFPTYQPMLSRDFSEFLSKEATSAVTEMVQHEIAVMIKGRASEELEKYRKLPAIEHNLPLRNDADKGFVFNIFKRYRNKLFSVNQFDTDDVVLSAIGQLDTPIWRRRRLKEGFDSVFVDETHLFNVNELSALHFLTRAEGANPIVFSADRTQAPGDRGLTSSLLDKAILSLHEDGEPKVQPTTVRSVFRCSPEITNLALSVTAAGATLFTNFDNPLGDASSAFTLVEEEKSKLPLYIPYPTDEAMLGGAFSRAEEMVKTLQCARSEVLIVAFSAEILAALQAKAGVLNKPVELLQRRGDIEVVNRAKKTGRFVLSMPDYVGGLEFDGVILVGVDDGRVPPTGVTATHESRHFLAFLAHTRLYVSITRARYQVEILGNLERGESKLLASAFSNAFLARGKDV